MRAWYPESITCMASDYNLQSHYAQYLRDCDGGRHRNLAYCFSHAQFAAGQNVCNDTLDGDHMHACPPMLIFRDMSLIFASKPSSSYTTLCFFQECRTAWSTLPEITTLGPKRLVQNSCLGSESKELLILCAHDLLACTGPVCLLTRDHV